VPADSSLRAVAAQAHLAARRNLMHLVELRWLAVGGQLVTIAAAAGLMGVPLPLVQMLTLLGLLGVFNFASSIRARSRLPVHEAELFAGLLMDVIVLTGQLYFSGGISNPFIFLYVLQVALGSVLLHRRYAWAILGFASAGFVALTAWHEPLAIATHVGADFSVPYVSGLLVCFLLDASLLVIFIERIGRSLRERDERLAQLRQRAAEEEHIVRMCLLASGAAHELGTPLATLSVILSDWSHMAPFAAEPELREEIEEMQRQIARCKQIVSSILVSAGSSRAEAMERTTLRTFFDELARQWRASRGAQLELLHGELPDPAIVSDPALRQMIDNVLDNALEAAPGGRIELQARCEHDELVVLVRDEGPGFAPGAIARLGTPYASTKGAAGRGLGLFLAVNVARTLGGSIRAHNGDHGAQVRIAIPLAALTVEADGSDNT
jgi:two-component system, sensor histidine kinase RegB